MGEPSSDPVGQVDPDLAEAERGMRSIVECDRSAKLAGPGAAIAVIRDDVRLVMAEYDRRGRIADVANAGWLSAEAELDGLHPELSRLRRIESAAREYLSHLHADRTQHWHARNQALRDALADALAAEVEKTDA